MHGADGFAGAFEEAQKKPLGKAIAILSVHIYRILQVSALHRESERCGEAERNGGKASLVQREEEINDFAFAVRILQHCRILR